LIGAANPAHLGAIADGRPSFFMTSGGSFMPRVSKAFFSVAVLTALVGMGWGMYMGKSGDHLLAPAHAHLNLLGWVSLSIMGTFYAVSGAPAGKVAWANFGLSVLGAVLMGALLPQVMLGKLPGSVMATAEIPAVLGMLLFAFSVLRSWRKAA
jgi:hypothetical protein